MNKKFQNKHYTFTEILVQVLIVFFTVIIFDTTGLMNWVTQMEVTPTQQIIKNIVYSLHGAAEYAHTHEPKMQFVSLYRQYTGFKQDAGFASSNVSFISSPEQETNEVKVTSVKRKSIDSSFVTFSSKRPMKLLLIGDSMMGWGIGTILEQAIKDDSLFSGYRFYKTSSGLNTTKYFNWNAQLQDLLQKDNYDGVVVMIGVNDHQHFSYNNKLIVDDTPEFYKVYRKRVREFLNIMKKEVKYVFWLGLPHMRDPYFDKKIQKSNNIFSDELAKYENVYLINTKSILDNGLKKYTMYGYDNGLQIKLRADDGIHVSTTGGEIVSKILLSAIKTANTNEYKFTH